MKQKSYIFTQKNAFWEKTICDIYENLEQEYLNLQTAVSIIKNNTLRKHITKGTGTDTWNTEDVCMILEALFVTKFQKENPQEHERISIDEIRNELRDEFYKNMHH